MFAQHALCLSKVQLAATGLLSNLQAAQVSDIAIAVREGTDAVMLSGETAYGSFPFKAVSVMSTVAKRTEASMLSYRVTLPPSAQATQALPGP